MWFGCFSLFLKIFYKSTKTVQSYSQTVPCYCLVGLSTSPVTPTYDSAFNYNQIDFDMCHKIQNIFLSFMNVKRRLT